MSTITSFRDFDAYKEARIFVKNLYALTRRKSISPDYALCDQMRRAAISTTSNFAEGCERGGKQEFIQFISYAKGATGETMTQLDIAVDQDYISAEQHREWDQSAEKARKLLAGLSNYLRKTEHAGLNFKRTVNSKQKTVNLPHRPGKNGFAIISTLLVLTVLTIMVVAFLQSMRIERLTARSYLNKTRADLAADAARDNAIIRLKNLITQNPYHAIGYEERVSQIVPVFYGASDGNTPPTFTYLFSTKTPQTAPTAFATSDSVDLNIKPGTVGGWIGSPVVNGVLTAAPAKAYWIDILLNPALPNQPDPKLADFNPIVARYAFWIEDETAKLDFTVSGNKNGTAGAFLRSPVAKTVSDLDLGALPLVAKKALAAGQENFNKVLIETRDLLPVYPFDSGLINRFAYPDGSADIRGDVKYHATSFSLSNDLSAAGRRRINLNHLVTNVTPTTLNAASVIAADLDDIVFAISGKHVFSGLNNATHTGLLLDKAEEPALLRNFGKRFYTSPALPTTFATLKDNHEMTYLLRLAANIRDYIDSDNLPTFIDYTGTLLYGTRPNFSWRSGEEPVAIGKESVPSLQEHAWRGVQTQYDVVANATGQPANRRRISFTLDHYFEFYNSSTKDFIAPAGTELKIYNLPTFNNNTASGPITLPDMTLNLAGTVFPAGQAVVITTCPGTAATNDPPDFIRSSNVVRITVPSSARSFGPFLANETVGSSPTRYGTQLNGRTSASTDYQSEMILSTPQGVLGAHPFLALTADFSMTRSTDTNNQTRFIFATNLRGNDNISRSGDSRSLSEPLELNAGSNAAFGSDQARFFSSITGGGTGTITVPGTSSFGIPSNSFINPGNWPDYQIPLTNNASNAYAWIKDGVMDSIGELGNIFDPHRKFSVEPAATIRSARGGGRTLKIGQQDDLVSGARFSVATPTSVGWFNASWRLLDIFSTGPAANALSPATQRGKLNINGVMRDKGVAFRALLRSFLFANAPEGDLARAGNSLLDNPAVTTDEVDNLVTQLEAYLRTNGPMMERGELSQLAFFSGAGSANTAGLAPSSTSMDRSREEIFRRIVELTTTRSSSFTVYCMGQAVQQSPAGKITRLSSSRKKASFTITPVISDNPLAVPTDYQVQIYANQQD